MAKPFKTFFVDNIFKVMAFLNILLFTLKIENMSIIAQTSVKRFKKIKVKTCWIERKLLQDLDTDFDGFWFVCYLFKTKLYQLYMQFIQRRINIQHKLFYYTFLIYTIFISFYDLLELKSISVC